MLTTNYNKLSEIVVEHKKRNQEQTFLDGSYYDTKLLAKILLVTKSISDSIIINTHDNHLMIRGKSFQFTLRPQKRLLELTVSKRTTNVDQKTKGYNVYNPEQVSTVETHAHLGKRTFYPCTRRDLQQTLEQVYPTRTIKITYLKDL